MGVCDLGLGVGGSKSHWVIRTHDCLQVSFSISLGTLGTVSFTRVPTELPMAMAQYCLCIKTLCTHLCLEGEDQLPTSSSGRGDVPPAKCPPSTLFEALTVHGWYLNIESLFSPYTARKADVSLILLSQCKKFEIKIIQTMPTGITSSWQCAPVPTCLCKAFYTFLTALQDWDILVPHLLDHVGNSVSGHLSLLAKGQQGCLMPKLELCTCPEIYGEKPEENSDVHCVHWVRTDFGSTYSR